MVKKTKLCPDVHRIRQPARFNEPRSPTFPEISQKVTKILFLSVKPCSMFALWRTAKDADAYNIEITVGNNLHLHNFWNILGSPQCAAVTVLIIPSDIASNFSSDCSGYSSSSVDIIENFFPLQICSK